MRSLASLPALTACLLCGGGIGGGLAPAHAFQSVAPPARRQLPALSNHHRNSALRSSSDPNDEGEEEGEGALEGLRKQIAAISDSLNLAKKRREDAARDVNNLRGERDDVAIETEAKVEGLKKGLVEEMTTLSDKIEGAQDGLRETVAKTRSDIAAIQQEAKEREGRLKNEITDLEDRLAALRQEADAAAKERDAFQKEMRTEVRVVRDAARKELEKAKKDSYAEKRELTKQKWEYENRIQNAKVDVLPSKKELEEEKKLWDLPKIAGLKDALEEMKRKMTPQVEDLKQKRAAKEMFFDKKWEALRKDKKEELNAAKGVYEGEIAEEDAKIVGAAASYELEMGKREEELKKRTAELATDPEASATYTEAVAKAEKEIEDLGSSILNSVEQQEKDWANALKDAVESHAAIRDQYDAEYENARYNLQRQKDRSERKLRQEDEWRENRRNQLQQEKEELGNKLSQLLEDEAAANDADYAELQTSKTAELNAVTNRNKAAISEIQTTRSNLIFVKEELRRLEQTSEDNQHRLEELEEERGSFRRQLRRTMAVAVGKITRR